MKFRQFVAAFLITLVIILITLSPSAPHSDAEIEKLSRQLFEFGAISYFHDHVEDSAIFTKVALGEELDEIDSCEYRMIYEGLIAESAGLLEKLDENIQFRNDFGMAIVNNCAAFGLPGHQDVHDLSAADNIRDLASKVDQLSDASAFTRMRLNNDIQKDLIDLVVHFAPATHAVGLRHESFVVKDISGDLAQSYADMAAGFKDAQFAPINGCEYWQGVDQALAAYVQIVKIVQDVTQSELTSIERKISGRWLSPQTLAPILDANAPIRPRPSNC